VPARPSPQPTGDAGTPPSAPIESAATAPLRLATFNLHIFGPTKASRPAWLADVAAIIRRYDLVAVQEIIDVSGRAPARLLDAINETGDPVYEIALSPRTGREPDDRDAQEQYAYFFRTDTIAVVGESTLFDDSAHDYFQREPYLSRFSMRSSGASFVLMNIHTRPRAAVSEIAAMEHVFAWAQERFAGEEVFIALGDFNAGCGYATEQDLDALPIHGEAYDWVVPHSADTNVAGSACAYDRIVISSPSGNLVVEDWGVDRAFDEAEPLSDHYPVWVTLIL
jgi:deoxyribonuclease-1-like protein